MSTLKNKIARPVCVDCSELVEEKFILTVTAEHMNVICLKCLQAHGTRKKTRVLETEFYPLKSLV